ncbi:MAG: hypothetical protein AB2L16_05945 [Anaerolineaceae bacterium]
MEKPNIRTVAEALAGPDLLGCAVKENGVLVVVDSTGKKSTFYPMDYQHLLHPGSKSAAGKGAKHASAQ